VRGLFKSSAGFTYLAALVLVIVLGIMLGAAAQSWTMVMKREREAELLFRGRQIVEAIARWYKPQATAGVPPRVARPLTDLKDLLTDSKSLSKVRYLRRDPATTYNDPITGKEWAVIRDASQRIIGVASTSEDTPLKQGGFLEANYPLDATRDSYLITMFKNFEGKTKYKDWQFVYQAAGPQPVSNQLPGAGKIH
jgi:type II secretory pathway pseudopilin PulG